jgi:hypothetical protein
MEEQLLYDLIEIQRERIDNLNNRLELLAAIMLRNNQITNVEFVSIKTESDSSDISPG